MRGVVNQLLYIVIVANTPKNLFVQKSKVSNIHVERDAPDFLIVAITSARKRAMMVHVIHVPCCQIM